MANHVIFSVIVVSLFQNQTNAEIVFHIGSVVPAVYFVTAVGVDSVFLTDVIVEAAVAVVLLVV